MRLSCTLHQQLPRGNGCYAPSDNSPLCCIRVRRSAEPYFPIWVSPSHLTRAVKSATHTSTSTARSAGSNYNLHLQVGRKDEAALKSMQVPHTGTAAPPFFYLPNTTINSAPSLTH